MKNKFVFKILKYQEWFNNKNLYFGSKKDINDGFIHLSTYDQVQDTYKIHYYAQKNLIIVYFYIKDLNDKLKWENSRNNQLKFYTILDPDADDGILRMIIDTNGNIGVGTNDPKTIFQIDGTDALRIPVGDEAEKDNFENLAGQIRYNSTNSQFEGYGPGGTWGSLGGVTDVTKDTYISAENNPGDDNNQLKFYTVDIERMIIDANGNVGIGTSSPSYKLDVNGDMEATSYNATSDERLKENIKPIMNSLSKIIDLRGVNFTWIEDSSKNLQSGLIAQEVESVISEAVTTGTSKNKNGFYQKSINYSAIVPYLIEAVKELSIENQNLKRDLENLRIKEEENTENIKKYDKLISEIMDKLDK